MNQPIPVPDPGVGLIPTPAEAYNALPYHYDQDHDHPESVVRIPVAGPAPYNTLVYFRWQASVPGLYRAANGHTYHDSRTYQTRLVIANYDPNDPDRSTIRHTSTGYLSMMQITPEAEVFADDNTDFTAAIEMVVGDALIDETGRVSITVDTSSRMFQVFSALTANVSTWALIYEPRKQVGAKPIWQEAIKLHPAAPPP